MKFNYLLTSTLIGTSIAFIQPQVAQAQSPRVNQVAKEITVLVNSPNSNGSGVIIKKQGNNYTFITAAHVLAREDNYQIVSSDNQTYPIKPDSIKRIKGVQNFCPPQPECDAPTP